MGSGNILLEFYEQAVSGDAVVNFDGEEGQFAVSDGKGGIKWMKVYTAEEVGY